MRKGEELLHLVQSDLLARRRGGWRQRRWVYLVSGKKMVKLNEKNGAHQMKHVSARN